MGVIFAPPVGASGAQTGTLTIVDNAGTQTVAAAAQEQNASLHEVTSNAESLATMAVELTTIISKFKM